MLYERRFAPFFVSPVVAGLEKDTHKPFLAGFDCIGAACKAEDFIANGTAKEQLAGICEAMWRPKMVSFTLISYGHIFAGCFRFCHGFCLLLYLHSLLRIMCAWFPYSMPPSSLFSLRNTRCSSLKLRASCLHLGDSAVALSALFFPSL